MASMTSTDATKATQALQAALPESKFYIKGSAEYETLNGEYFSGLESDYQPSIIVQVTSAADVAAFVKVIRPFAHTVPCAIRGAGQQPLPGCANVNNGITLDLSLLDSIELSSNKATVHLGAGVRWGKVYEKLDTLGLSVTGSRSAFGGVGGLALAGGLSFFSSRHGFICDNVINYEVVLSSGKIVNANAHENADLWVALRGGGNNLGIVTRFDLKTFEQGLLWGGNVFYFADKFPGQIQALVDMLEAPNASDLTHVIISIGFSAPLYAATGIPVMCLNQPYYLDAVENPPEIAAFTDITPQMDALNSMALKNVSAAADEQTTAGQTQVVRAAYINMHIRADVATLQAIAEIYTAALPPLHSVTGATLSLTFQPYPKSLLAASAASGGNVLGLSESDGPIVSVLLLSYWSNKTDDEAVISFMESTLEKSREVARKKCTLLPFIYMNYAFTGQGVIDSYGSANKFKLQAASKKYDPIGLFQKGFPGGFKLFT